jgi:hypothetical protein
VYPCVWTRRQITQGYTDQTLCHVASHKDAAWIAACIKLDLDSKECAWLLKNHPRAADNKKIPETLRATAHDKGESVVESRTYQLVFDGAVAPGGDLNAVKKNLAALFKRDIQAVERRLFSGSSVIFRRGLTQDDVFKYRQAFNTTGALCRIVAEGPGTTDQ